MIELERHIEILLLSNDCVIVPDLGGFMAHHIEARYDETEHMFLPPQRTLGFNPQLKLNDALLAQSYVEAHDISYPEAVRRIEAEVSELKQHLETEGYYELNDIGCLTVNNEGKLAFEPCEAGILTPELYGLSSFEMMAANSAATTIDKFDEEEQVKDSNLGGERAITIKMSWVRNALATAAALLAFFILSQPVSNSDSVDNVSLSQVNLPFITSTKTPAAKHDTVADVSLTTKDSIAAETVVADTVATEVKEQPKPEIYYCIVLASQVSKRGAEAFVKQLQQQGLSDVRIYDHHNIRRVVCGSYDTEAEAYRQLQQVHQHDGLAEAWVYKVKSEG